MPVNVDVTQEGSFRFIPQTALKGVAGDRLKTKTYFVAPEDIRSKGPPRGGAKGSQVPKLTGGEKWSCFRNIPREPVWVRACRSTSYMAKKGDTDKAKNSCGGGKN